MEYYRNCYSALLNSINCSTVTICRGWGFAAGCLVWATWSHRPAAEPSPGSAACGGRSSWCPTTVGTEPPEMVQRDV